MELCDSSNYEHSRSKAALSEGVRAITYDDLSKIGLRSESVLSLFVLTACHWYELVVQEVETVHNETQAVCRFQPSSTSMSKTLLHYALRESRFRKLLCGICVKCF